MSALSPYAQNQARGSGCRPASVVLTPDAIDYLSDMLRELSSIAAWAALDHARKHIDAALQEVEARKD